MVSLTFENNSIVRNPDIAKGPRVLTCLNKHPAQWARNIRENVDPRMLMKRLLDRLGQEAIPVLSRGCGEPCVEVRILRESQAAFLVLESAEVPKNFHQIRVFIEYL